jgi:hypothetical protein
MSLLTGEIAALISEGLAAADLGYPITLERYTPGTPDPLEPWEPVAATSVAWSTRGFEDKFTDYYVSRGVIRQGDRLIYLVAHTLATTPVEGDVLISRDGEPFVIIEVRTDPARALWECHARLGADA